MATTSTERPNFYELQYLGASDLAAVVTYGRKARARHDLGGHTWGIAGGLELVERVGASGGVEVFLEPGYAWDGFGRPLSVLQPVAVSAGFFSSITFDLATDSGSTKGRLVDVWLRYVEQPTSSAAAGFEVCDGDGFARVVETTALVVNLGSSPAHKDLHDEVTVGTLTADAREVRQKFDSKLPLVEDEAISQQTFPDGWADVRWLIPLGKVRWLPATGGSAGKFVARTADDLVQSARARRLVGVAGETFEAARGRIRLRERSRTYAPTVWSDDLVWVEGDLRVDGDAKLLDGRLVLRDAIDSGASVKPQLAVGRTERNDLAVPGSDLWVHIGEAETGKNRFVVGPVLVDGDAPSAKFVVRDDATAGIGVGAPTRPLEVRAKGDNDDVFGLHAAAGLAWLVGLKGDGHEGLTFYRDEAGTAVSRLFLELAADARVGVGTTSPTNKLHVVGGTGIRQNDQYLSGDVDTGSVLGVNVHRSADASTWVFPDTSRPALAMSVTEDASGELEWSLRSSRMGATQSLDYLLRAKGSTGDMYLCPTKGSVGIRTTAPAAELDVQGNAIVTGTLGVGTSAPSTQVQFTRDLTVGSFSARSGVGVIEASGASAMLAFTDRGYGGGVLAAGDSWGWLSSGRKARLACSNLADPAIVFGSDGKCGIGTDSPTCHLHVRDLPASDNANALSAHVALIENLRSSGGPDVLALKVNVNSPDSGCNFVTFFSQNAAVGAIERSAGGTVGFNTTAADFAECLPRSGAIARLAAGTVVGVHGGEVSPVLEGAQQLLVVSEGPIVLGNCPPREERDRFEPIAMLGQVPIRVRGTVRRGDVLLPSGRDDGVAVGQPASELVLEDLARVIAIAWEEHEGPAEGRVRGAVGLHGPLILGALVDEVRTLRDAIRALREERLQPHR